MVHRLDRAVGIVAVVDSSAAISGLGCRGAVISSLARKRN